MLKTNDLLTANIYKIFVKYVSTSIIGMIMNSIYILFDTIFIGQSLGKLGLAALNIAIPIYNLLFGIGILIGTGCATIISISVGNKNFQMANKAYDYSFILGTLIGVIFSILGIIFIDKICFFLGASQENFSLVKEYLGVVLPFSWSFIMVYDLTAIVRNDNGPRRAMIAMGLGGLTNVIFDYIFIFPFSMGMRGAAIATVMSSLVSLIILSPHFKGRFPTIRYKSFDTSLIIRIFKIGVSGFIIELSSGLIIFIFNQELLSLLGDIGVSAYSIIANIGLMATSIFNGISQGIQPIVSINFGAGNIERTYLTRKLGAYVSIFFGLIFLYLGLAYPELLVSAFTSERGDLLSITKYGMKIYFLAFPIIGLNMVLSGYFQSIEKTNYSINISILRGFVLYFICLKLLTAILNSTGIWLTTLVAELITFLIIFILVMIDYKSYNY